MGDDKRRRSPSNSPQPRCEDGGRGGRHDRNPDRDLNWDRGRERDRERDRNRGREYDRGDREYNRADRGRGLPQYDDDRGGGSSGREAAGKDEQYEVPAGRHGACGDRERRQRDRDDRGWRGGGDTVKREREPDREGSGRGGQEAHRLGRDIGGGGGGRDVKRERSDGDWGPAGGAGGGDGRRGGGGRGRRDAESSRYMSREEREAKEREAEEAARPKPPKEQPNLGLSGKLAAETNMSASGKELKHVPPPEARVPDKRWRLYIFKNDQLQDEPYRIHRLDHYLFGRDVSVADIIIAHPSCSKQHAVLQFRLTEKEDQRGVRASAVRPYLLDLGSVNGTFLNGERLEALRYYELLEKDVVRFGQSTREYVLLHDQSGDE